MNQVATMTSADPALLTRITERAFAQTIHMIFEANTRKDKRPGDPKVGGHPASCASSLHILGALHLAAREPQDYVCCKPHAAPMDHAFHHLLRLFGREDGTWFDDDRAKAVMSRLRKFAEPGAEDVFQSYHARSDPDSFHFLPSGSVGIPPVASVYLALAYRYMEDHEIEVPPNAHFWSLIGDSEFREGSLLEAMPDAAERQLGNVTWIIDYNRQNLDGTRIPNEKGLHSRDCDRIRRTAEANGWKVLELEHGSFRDEVFARPGGDSLRRIFEKTLSDYEYQLALFNDDAELARRLVAQHSKDAAKFCEGLSDEDLLRVFADLGGHDMAKLTEALTSSRLEPTEPYIVIAHTVKGWGLECAADPSNHSALPNEKEVLALLAKQGLDADDPYAHFPQGSDEDAFLAERRAHFQNHMETTRRIRKEKRAEARRRVEEAGGLPDTIDIDLSLYPEVHTQWMWGQIAAKLVRISTANAGGPQMGGSAKELNENEKRWASVADFVLTLSPDVGTSTNISPILDQKIYGPTTEAGDVKFEARHPELIAASAPWTRHIRFEIAEANCMTAAGSFGRMAHYTGNPSFPIMTVYDFFIKRALDQLYYNLYWGSEFVIVGTPSGVTLSSEGAQHSWKSDIQIPNLITWEPFFALEMDWILSDAIKRHMLDENEGRRGVLVRAVTRAVKQKLFRENLLTQARFKASLPEGALLKPKDAGADWSENSLDESTVPALPIEEIQDAVRRDCLEGAYYLVDYRGYEGYEPGDNVVQLFSMGSPTTEALEASRILLERGIYANVIVISSPELLLGILGHQTGYRHLREGLGVTGDLYAVDGAEDSTAGLLSVAGRRVPIVAVCDGEAGLVDNIGSIVGVKQETLAVRKFSKCGRPDQVYRYQDLHADAIVEACGRVLSETALENLRISPSLLGDVDARGAAAGGARVDWRELWPEPEA